MAAAVIIIATLHPIRDKHTHTHRVPFPEISRASKITPLSWLIVHSYLARTTCQNFTSPSVVFTIIQILSKYLGTYTIDINEQT